MLLLFLRVHVCVSERGLFEVLCLFSFSVSFPAVNSASSSPSPAFSVANSLTVHGTGLRRVHGVHFQFSIPLHDKRVYCCQTAIRGWRDTAARPLAGSRGGTTRIPTRIKRRHTEEGINTGAKRLHPGCYMICAAASFPL